MSADPSPFPAYNEDDWRKAASAALKGASLDKLRSKTTDGIVFGPIHAPAVGPRPLIEPRSAWAVISRVDHVEPGEANAAALDDLENGADGLQVVFAGAAGSYGYGLPGCDPATLHKVFEGVRFEGGLQLELDLGPAGIAQAEAFAAHLERVGATPDGLSLAFGIDPIGARLRSGKAPAAWDAEAKALAATAAKLKAQGFPGPYLAADGRSVHAAGGTPAQELGFVLAAAVAYWRALESGGFAPDAARAAISFRLAADADQFVTLAKFRALRLLVGERRTGGRPRRRALPASTPRARGG